jgi:ATP-dependent exoDNAse (exonuclease V) beta subunit
MPAEEEDEKDGVRVFYVAAPRGMQRLVMGLRAGSFGSSWTRDSTFDPVQTAVAILEKYRQIIMEE